MSDVKNVGKCNECGTLRSNPDDIGQRCYLAPLAGGPKCQGRIVALSDSPVCPHCGADPVELLEKGYRFSDGVAALMLYCANLQCRKIVGASFLGMQKTGGGKLIL